LDTQTTVLTISLKGKMLLSFLLVGLVLPAFVSGDGLVDNPIVGDSIVYLDGTWSATAQGLGLTIPAQVPGERDLSFPLFFFLFGEDSLAYPTLLMQATSSLTSSMLGILASLSLSSISSLFCSCSFFSFDSKKKKKKSECNFRHICLLFLSY
jgi:hypothetical protein